MLLTKDVDMNDGETMGFYNVMQSFISDPETEGMALVFPASLTPEQHDTVRCLAAKLKLDRLCDPEKGCIAITRRQTAPVQDHPHLFSDSSSEFRYYRRPFPTTRPRLEYFLSSQNNPSSPTARLRF